MHDFFQSFLQKLIIALNDGSSYALIALGYTMVYGVLRLINFAHGDVFMIGAFVGAYAARFINLGMGRDAGAEQTIWMAILGILCAMVVCGGIGFTIERVAYRPLRKAPKLSALITAIGVSLFIEYLLQIKWHFGGYEFFGPDPLRYPPIAGSGLPVPHAITLPLLHWHIPLPLPDNLIIVWKDLIVIIVAAVTLIGLTLFVRRTRTGKAMRAISINATSAQLMGVNLNRVISFTFVLGSMLAAIGGCLWGLNRNQCDPLMGIIPGLKAFVAAVIGGIGNIPGAAAGGFLLALVEVFVSSITVNNTAILSPYKDAISFVILILMLLLRPEGIFGKAVPEKV